MTVIQFVSLEWLAMSQNVTFLSLCFLIQIYYFKNDANVTITSQIISATILVFTKIIQENVLFDLYQMSMSNIFDHVLIQKFLRQH